MAIREVILIERGDLNRGVVLIKTVRFSYIFYLLSRIYLSVVPVD